MRKGISNVTVNCNAWLTAISDIYMLTHLQSGQRATMSLARSNIAVG